MNVFVFRPGGVQGGNVFTNWPDLMNATPNVLIRCDGTTAFTQNLPSISAGFKIGNTSESVYTGGQEVVIAEVAGGAHARVRAAAGDTIDGQTSAVKIGPRASKTFVSDGLSNWITIAEAKVPNA